MTVASTSFPRRTPWAIASAWRGRAVAASIVAAYFVMLLARGGRRAWGHLGVTLFSPPFFDMRSVTSAWECTRRGIAVLPHNPCDPLRRPANYPSIWLWPSHLGLGVSSTAALGWATAVTFLLTAIVVIPRKATVVQGAVYGVAVCSPAVMLGIENGNVDLLVFGVVAAGVILMRRGGWGAALLLVAAILKLFPLFAWTALLRLPARRALLAVVAVVAAFCVYALATFDTTRAVLHSFPQVQIYYSYGIKAFWRWAANVSSTYHLHVPGAVWGWAVIALAVASGVALRGRLRPRLDIAACDRDLDLFVAGASIYVGTFSLAQNFDYRLAFLLLTIPQLYSWARARRMVAHAGLALVMATLWLGSLWWGVPVIRPLLDRWERATQWRPFFGYDQPLTAASAAQLLLAIVLIVILAAVLPSLSIRIPRIRLGLTYTSTDLTDPADPSA
jgi:hypothetical protein